MEAPRYDRRETSHAFFASLLGRIDALEEWKIEAKKQLESIDRGVWCIVKTMRLIGLGVFLAFLAILPELGKAKGWW